MCVCVCEGEQEETWARGMGWSRQAGVIARRSLGRRGVPLHGERREGKGEGRRIEEEKRHKGFVAHVTSRPRWLTGRHFRTQSKIPRRLPGTEAKYFARSF